MLPQDINTNPLTESHYRRALWEAARDRCEHGMKHKEVLDNWKSQGVKDKPLKNTVVVFKAQNEKMEEGLLSGEYDPDTLADQIRESKRAGLSSAEIKDLEPEKAFYVYVIGQPGTHFHKVGRTVNPPKVRFNEAQRGNPYQLEKVARISFPTKGAMLDAEREMLRLGKCAPGGREWREDWPQKKGLAIAREHGGSVLSWQ